MCKTRLTLRFGHQAPAGPLTNRVFRGWEIDRMVARRRQRSRELLEGTRRLLVEAKALLRHHAQRN